MPAAVAVPAIATAIAGGASAAVGIYGSKQQGKAARTAAQLQAYSTAQALAFEREQEATRQREFAAQQEEAKRQWEAQQAFQQQQFAAQEEQRLHDRALADALEARRAPYRAASQAALTRLGDILGLTFDGRVTGPVVAPAGSPTASGTLPIPNQTAKTLGGILMAPPVSGTMPVAGTDQSYQPVTMASILKSPRRSPYANVYGKIAYGA